MNLGDRIAGLERLVALLESRARVDAIERAPQVAPLQPTIIQQPIAAYLHGAFGFNDDGSPRWRPVQGKPGGRIKVGTVADAFDTGSPDVQLVWDDADPLTPGQDVVWDSADPISPNEDVILEE